jgi:hypothetical protein
MTTPYPTPITVNPTGAPILPGQNLDNPTNAQSPTVPAPVTATAPTGQTSTTSQPATPTAVVSSGPAQTDVSNIQGTLSQAQQDLINQGSANAAAAQNAATAAATAKTTAATTTTTTPTPEETIANTPDTGNEWVYDSQGNRTQAAIGTTLPAGYSTTNPVAGPTLPVTSQVTDPSGNQLVQYSDGSYGKLNAKGQYVGVSNSQDFQTAQMAADTLNKLNQAANGAYPLTASQQSQITSVTSSYQNLIDTWTKLNAQNSSIMNNMSNLYGGGVSMSELSQLSGVVSEGMVRVAQAQAAMAKAVSDMTTAFDQQNFTELKSMYDEYQTQSANVQKEIDTINTAAQTAQKNLSDEVEANLTQQLDSDKFTYQQKQDAITNAREQGVLDETKAKDLADELTAREVAAKGTYQLKINPDGTESIFSTVTGQVVGTPTNDVSSGAVSPGNTGIPLLDAPGNTKTTSSGLNWVDGSNMSTAEQKAANLDAVRVGMTYLPPASANIENNIETARSNIQMLESDLSTITSSNAITRPFNSIKNTVEGLTQMGGSAPSVESYNIDKNSLITAFKAFSGPGTSGARGNQLIQQLMAEIPNVSDTKAVAAAKIAKFNSLLDNEEKSLFGEKAWNAANPDKADSYSGVTLPGANATSTSSGSTYNGITLPN